MKFKVGQLVIYRTYRGYEIGKIKSFKDKVKAFVWFTSGDTASLIPIYRLEPLLNDYALEDILNKE